VPASTAQVTAQRDVSQYRGGGFTHPGGSNVVAAQWGRRELLVRWAWASTDAGIWGIAIGLASWMRFDFRLGQVAMEPTLVFAGVAVVAQLVVGGLFGPYAVGHQRGSFEEIMDLGRTVAIVGLGLFAWSLVAQPVMVPRSVPVSSAALALLAMYSARFAVRAARNQQRGARDGERRVILFGAGNAGRQLMRNIVLDVDGPFVPDALLDDDRAKARLRIDGVRVRGTRRDLAAVAGAQRATDLVVALPNAEAALIRELTEQAEALGLNTMVLPPLSELIDGRPTTGDLRDVQLEDLLARRPVQLDQDAIAGQISGRTVLVTGAGGSIGSELRRQIAEFGPAKLLLLDRDESALHATQLTLSGHGLLDDDVLLADILDSGALDEVFLATGPRWCSTPPPSSTCRCWSATRWRRGRPTCWAPSTCWPRRSGPGWAPSSTSPPTRRPALPACWATASGSRSGSPRTTPGAASGASSASASATCSARAGRWCRPSPPRSPGAGR